MNKITQLIILCFFSFIMFSCSNVVDSLPKSQTQNGNYFNHHIVINYDLSYTVYKNNEKISSKHELDYIINDLILKGELKYGEYHMYHDKNTDTFRSGQQEDCHHDMVKYYGPVEKKHFHILWLAYCWKETKKYRCTKCPRRVTLVRHTEI